MTDQTMIERVARVLANNRRINYGKPFEALSPQLQEAFRADARDALTAMREPTE
jgi:hypothetical protein